ncbi:uncharacterized protein V2V93DRAFT_319502 [Kockiozyma suomiensis]|uniref:uncharacterized protein n=1 Tax=Kockiozyma suomiensis TaxID=1337062 RepID=UPI0033435C21
MGDSSVLEQLSAQLFEDALNPPHEAKGVDQTFLDSLDRIPRKKLKKDDTCAICNTAYLEDQYPLVVKLPCNDMHHFDLECIGPWLKLHATCPLCRKDLLKKKEPVVIEDDEEPWDDTFG